MALTDFEKQDNLIKRLINKCNTDDRYSITIVAKNIWNIHNIQAHRFYLNYFIKNKKKNTYSLIKPIYDKYEADKRFKNISSSVNHVTIQYYVPDINE